MLAPTGPTPFPDRCHYSSGDMEGGILVGVEVAGLERWPALVACDVAEARQGLGARAEGDVVGPGARVTQGGHGDHDEVGPHLHQFLVAEPQIAHHPGAVVLDYHVAQPYKLQE